MADDHYSRVVILDGTPEQLMELARQLKATNRISPHIATPLENLGVQMLT